MKITITTHNDNLQHGWNRLFDEYLDRLIADYVIEFAVPGKVNSITATRRAAPLAGSTPLEDYGIELSLIAYNVITDDVPDKTPHLLLDLRHYSLEYWAFREANNDNNTPWVKKIAKLCWLLISLQQSI